MTAVQTQTTGTSAILPTDAELLMRFVEHADEGAFAALVEQHAPLVNNVCRRVLTDRHDVEDAFQATFLVLARDARQIKTRDSVASWLFKVAHRTALRAAVDRRNRREIPLEHPTAPAGAAPPCDALSQIQDRETFEILAEELKRLPERYRTPLVLFYLEGRSRRTAADELDCTVPAFKAKLARGRQMLRQRLIRRGAALSLVLTASQAASASASAASAAFVENTVKAGLEYAATGTPGAAGSSNSVLLAEELKLMATMHLSKSLAAGLLLAVGLVTAVAVGGHQLTAAPNASAADGESPNRVNPILKKADDARAPAPTGVFVAAAEPKEASEADRAGGDGRAADKQGFRSVLFERQQAGAVVDARAAAEKAADNPPRFRERAVHLKASSPAEKRIESALEETTQIEFVDTPLQDAVEFLSELHNIPIILDRAAFGDKGVPFDQPLTQKLSEVRLESALDILLEPHGLTYLVEDDVLKITSTKIAATKKETRVYPVDDLVDAGFDLEALTKIVEEHTGADVASLAGPGLLVVTQPQRGHSRTAELFAQLRRSDAVPTPHEQFPRGRGTRPRSSSTPTKVPPTELKNPKPPR